MNKPISVAVDGKMREYFTYAFVHAYSGSGEEKEILDSLTTKQLKVITEVAALAHLILVEKETG